MHVSTLSQILSYFLCLLAIALLPQSTRAPLTESSITPQHNITKRRTFTPGGTKPKGYDDLVTKGDQLLKMMEGTITEANAIYKNETQSRWKPNDLTNTWRYGWKLTKAQTEDFPTSARAHMETMAKDPKLNTKYPPNTDFVFDHSELWRYSGGWNLKPKRGLVAHKATGAQYRNTINPIDGLVVATVSYSPRYKVEISKGTKNELTAADIPPLDHWADLTFIEIAASMTNTAKLRGAKYRNLNYIVRARVTNTKFLELMRYLIGGDDPELHTIENWDKRLECEITSDECKALLATPNMKASAWLLISYKRYFKVKRICKISVWNGESEKGSGQRNPHVLLWVEVVDGKGPE